MYNLPLLIILILMIYELSWVNSQGCSTPGWFGPNCEFKCHCENDICDSATGQCTGNTKCMRGWFGVGCQYQDLTSVPSTTITSSPLQTSNTWITDRDDSTCNQDIYLQSVVVAWNITYPFSWLRLAAKDNAYPGTFMVSFKTSGGSLTETPCNSQRIYVIDTKTVDISCQMTVDVMQVIIRGQSVKSLCSLYISGGRNIALKQSATQSSTYTLEGLRLSQASNAVDGNTSGNIRMNTCTHTAGVGDSPPNWTVTFRENHAVNRIVLYNRFDSADVPCCPERLMHFGLQTFNANYSPVFSYRDAGDTALLTYTVTVPDAQRHVLINGIRVDSNIQVLTLCEVQAFGECAPGTWGLECKNKCNPSCGTSCDVENGLCQSCIGFSSPPTCDIECESNQWGINCHQNCSTQCYVQSCNSRTGVCDKGCNGYNDPPFCTVPCPRTTWGLNCMGSCSNCIEMSCDKQSGKCDKGCDGYSNPPICNTECTSGLWGRDCRYSCSSHCSNTSCDRHSGICDEGCNGYDNFPDCNQKCLPGKWGANCTNRCNNCVNRSCDHVSGKCSAACEVGYINFPDCSPAPSQVQENPLLNTVIGLGIALGVACAFSIVLLVLMFARKRKGTLIETKRDPPNYDTATSGKEYFRQYETAVTKDPYQNACTSYEKTREQRTLEKSNAQPYKVYEEDTNAMNEYESIGLNKF